MTRPQRRELRGRRRALRRTACQASASTHLVHSLPTGTGLFRTDELLESSADRFRFRQFVTRAKLAINRTAWSKNSFMRGALKMVSAINGLSVLVAMWQLTRLSNANVHAPPDSGALAVLGVVLLGVMLLGVACSIALILLAYSSSATKWGGTFIGVGFLAPFMLMVFLLS